MNKRCVFTVITGGYDIIQEPSILTNGYDYICITDNSNIISKNWKIHPISDEHMKIICPKRRANAVAMNYHDYLSENYEICIYVDGNVKIKKNMEDFLSEFGFDVETYDLMLPNHPDRACIYQEGSAVIRLKKDDPTVVDQQMRSIRREGYPANNGLYETHLMVFNRNSKALREFLGKLFSTYMSMPSKRDQLVFNYVLWKNNTGIRVLSHKSPHGSRGKDRRPYNNYVEVMAHTPNHSKENGDFIIFENTPFRIDKNLIKAYNEFMEMMPENGWALFRDADTLFLDPFYGEVFERAIRNNPDAGCFTCLTNRIGNEIQLHGEYSGDDIKIHRDIAQKIKEENYNQYSVFPFNPLKKEALSGMVILLSKKSWKSIGGFKKSTIPVRAKNVNLNILGVDNQLHKDLNQKRIPLKIIKEMYVYHWYRGGEEDKTHLETNSKYTHKSENKTPIQPTVRTTARDFLNRRGRR